MHVLVLNQRLLLGEALVTHGATVRLLAGVDQHVDLEVVLPTEPFAAENARERTLARVDPLVTVQVLLGLEGLAAVAARVGTLLVGRASETGWGGFSEDVPKVKFVFCSG